MVKDVPEQEELIHALGVVKKMKAKYPKLPLNQIGTIAPDNPHGDHIDGNHNIHIDFASNVIHAQNIVIDSSSNPDWIAILEGINQSKKD